MVYNSLKDYYTKNVISLLEQYQNNDLLIKIKENPESLTYEELCEFETLCDFIYWFAVEFPPEVWKTIKPIMEKKLQKILGAELEKVEAELTPKIDYEKEETHTTEK